VEGLFDRFRAVEDDVDDRLCGLLRIENNLPMRLFAASSCESSSGTITPYAGANGLDDPEVGVAGLESGFGTIWENSRGGSPGDCTSNRALKSSKAVITSRRWRAASSCNTATSNTAFLSSSAICRLLRSSDCIIIATCCSRSRDVSKLKSGVYSFN